jgi:signal transduction histidine kinase
MSFASDRDVAQDLVKKAKAYVKYQGKEKAIAEINKQSGMFDRGELYVVAYDFHGVVVAHPKNAALIGKNLIQEPDFEGKLFRDAIVEIAKMKGSGWVDYAYLKPESLELEYKSAYVQKAGDIIICCGAYKDYSHGGD